MDSLIAKPEVRTAAHATREDFANRTQFLLAMYRAMWDNINRHILVVWQSFATLFAALAAYYLSGKQFLSPDIGTTLIVLAAGWAIAHAIDSAGWYNRNLLIITNIERQFLFDEDAEHIHYFFRAHRGSRPIEHLMIQIILAVAIAFLALVDHFASRVFPGFSAPWNRFEASRAVPYIVILFVAPTLWCFKRDLDKKYAALLCKSPGEPPRARTPVSPVD